MYATWALHIVQFAVNIRIYKLEAQDGSKVDAQNVDDNFTAVETTAPTSDQNQASQQANPLLGSLNQIARQSSQVSRGESNDEAAAN